MEATDRPALSRVRRLFLGWSDFGATDGYETFGWWDLQGDGTHADAVAVEADVELVYDDHLDDCFSDSKGIRYRTCFFRH